MAKNVLTKYKNFLDYDDEYEFSSKIRANKPTNKTSFEEERFDQKRKKQKKFTRNAFSSYDE